MLRRRSLVPFVAAIALTALLAPSPASAVSPDVVISQVYGGGGNPGATFTHDFVELFNRGTAPVDVTGWSVQYASAAGTTWQVTPLAGTIEPGRYYLVQQAAGAGGATPLPTPDAIGGTGMSASNGKVAVVTSSFPMSGPGGPGPSVRDFVGYGTANVFEGSAAAPGPTNTTAALRLEGGCQDTDDNAADFVEGPPTPRNSASPAHSCGGPPPCLDEDPPAVTVELSTTALWPPNHRLRTVEAAVTVTDLDPAPTVELVSVTSSEPDDARGIGDGRTAGDIEVVDDETFRLRAERAGRGEGRVYTITYRAVDACGNETIAAATVEVPHSRRD